MTPLNIFALYSKACVKRPLSKRLKIVLNNYPPMQVKCILECSTWSILQYFRPSFSYHLSLISWFCLFLSGHFTQVYNFIGNQPYLNNKLRDFSTSKALPRYDSTLPPQTKFRLIEFFLLPLSTDNSLTI